MRTNTQNYTMYIAASIYDKNKELFELNTNLDSLDKDNDFNKFLPEILNIFKDLPSHWTSLNKESQRSFNNLIFPKLDIVELKSFPQKISLENCIFLSSSLNNDCSFL